MRPPGATGQRSDQAAHSAIAFGVGELDALRRPGRARRVDDRREVVGPDRLPGLGEAEAARARPLELRRGSMMSSSAPSMLHDVLDARRRAGERSARSARKCASVITTRLPALRNWWAICSVRARCCRPRTAPRRGAGSPVSTQVELGPVEQHDRRPRRRARRRGAASPEAIRSTRAAYSRQVIAIGVAGVAQRDLVGPLGGGQLERVAERGSVERPRARRDGDGRGGVDDP